ncbi:MAG: SDR family oxidoreductase [Chloroflexi bacterium]|nr:SDR family oxidoreductase [Chloroflexota bacterium]
MPGTSSAPTVVITGASAGIGAAAVRRFARGGYRVALAARRRERLEALASELRAGGAEALVVPTDVTDWSQVHTLAQTVLERWGYVDVLINNAGLGRLARLDDLDPQADVAFQIQVNLTGAIWVAQAFLPAMRARRRGVIINVSSVAGWVGLPLYTVYAATKFGLRGFTESLRREVLREGIHVVGFYPGPVATEFGQHAFKRASDRPRAASWPGVALSADAVAEALWDLAHHPRRGVVQPWWMAPLVWLNAHVPWLGDWLLNRVMLRSAKAPKARDPNAEERSP